MPSLILALQLLNVSVSRVCVVYGSIAVLHLWWALQEQNAVERRDHFVDAALHAALAAVHAS